MPAGSVEDVITQEMAASGVPGLAYAVVDNGEVVAVGARGVMNSDNGREVTPDTPFLIGSISKSFTAMAVVQLVEAGLIDLDAGISEYLADFEGSPGGLITARQLLSHTSGYSTYQGNSSYAVVTSGDDELAQRVQALAEVEPAYPAGQRWEYSNTNYEVLGRIVEVVSGVEFQTYVERNILEPIGMEDSFVSDGEIHDEMATGHRPWFITKLPLADRVTHRGTAPQGGIVASANDMALYMQTMMNGEDDVITAEGKALMMDPADPELPYYGLGWVTDTEAETVWHSGSTPGVETLATLNPDEGDGVVVLVNGGSGIGYGETTQLRNAVTAAALGNPYEGEGSRWLQKILFLSLVFLPVVYVISMAWAWRKRDAIRAKREMGFSGLFSLWFPLATTVAAAWFILWLMPRLLGAPLGTIRLFQPDFALALIATAVLGIVWAVFRLIVAYTGHTPVVIEASPASPTPG